MKEQSCYFYWFHWLWEVLNGLSPNLNLKEVSQYSTIIELE